MTHAWLIIAHNEFGILQRLVSLLDDAACDIYIQPSRYEGHSVTVREAQILGKPVIITNYPTAKSQIQDGVDGIICGMR